MLPLKFAYSMEKRQPTSLGELMKKVHKYIQVDEEMTLKRPEMGGVNMDMEFQKDPNIGRKSKGVGRRRRGTCLYMLRGDTL